MVDPRIQRELYQPEISPGSPLTPMPATDITITPRNTVLLQYPFDTLLTTLTLRNPELNDTIGTVTQRVQGYTRGDTLYQYKDTRWFQTRIFNWTFTGLTKQNKIDILNFINISAGKYITVTDHNSQVFKCIIVNPDAPITQEGPDYAQLAPNSALAAGSLYTWKVDLQKALV